MADHSGFSWHVSHESRSHTTQFYMPSYLYLECHSEVYVTQGGHKNELFIRCEIRVAAPRILETLDLITAAVNLSAPCPVQLAKQVG